MRSKLSAVLAMSLAFGFVVGCGRSNNTSNETPGAQKPIADQSKAPSDSDISNAIKEYCAQIDDLQLKSPRAWLNSMELPQSPYFDGLLSEGNTVALSDVRVVKRGKPYYGGFPVRVAVKGVRTARYGKFESVWTNSMGMRFTQSIFVKDLKVVNLPFEGVTEFVIRFQSPDMSKVDPGPGRWFASAN